MKVHETAFVVSTYRSQHEQLSKDIYAKLWNNPQTDLLIPEILSSVSPHEAILHSLRNRFFHDSLQDFFSTHPNGIFINFGAGFSMYQFQFPKDVQTIEIDKEDIIKYKKDKVNHWIKNNILPDQNITYININFNIASKEDLIAAISPYVKQRPIFILIEGVLFFLDKKVTNKLFSVFHQLTKKGDQIGSVSYAPEVTNTEVYQRLLHYFDSNNDSNDSFQHQTIPHEYYENIKGFSLKEKNDAYTLSQLHCTDIKINNPSEILNESFYILERK